MATGCGAGGAGEAGGLPFLALAAFDVAGAALPVRFALVFLALAFVFFLALAFFFATAIVPSQCACNNQ